MRVIFVCEFLFFKDSFFIVILKGSFFRALFNINFFIFIKIFFLIKIIYLLIFLLLIHLVLVMNLSSLLIIFWLFLCLIVQCRFNNRIFLGIWVFIYVIKFFLINTIIWRWVDFLIFHFNNSFLVICYYIILWRNVLLRLVFFFFILFFWFFFLFLFLTLVIIMTSVEEFLKSNIFQVVHNLIHKDSF